MKTVDWENLKNQLAQASGSQHLSKSLNQSTRPMDCQPKPTLKYGVLALGSYSILKMWIGCQHFKIRKFHTKNPASSFSLDKLESDSAEHSSCGAVLLRSLGPSPLLAPLGLPHSSLPAQPLQIFKCAVSALSDLFSNKKGTTSSQQSERLRAPEGGKQEDRKGLREEKESWNWVSSPSQNCFHWFKGLLEAEGNPWGHFLASAVAILQMLV